MLDMEAPSARLPLLPANLCRRVFFLGFFIFLCCCCSSMVHFTQKHYVAAKEADIKKTLNSIVPVLQGRG